MRLYLSINLLIYVCTCVFVSMFLCVCIDLSRCYTFYFIYFKRWRQEYMCVI